MKYLPILMPVTVWLCSATKPPAFYFEHLLLDRVSAQAKVGSATRTVALEALERVAEGRLDTAAPDTELKMGLKPNELRTQWFKDGSVRAYALQKIAETDLPEALEYLQNLKSTDIEPDSTGMVWPMAQMALRLAQLNRIPDEPAKIRFLEDTTTEHTAAARWAVNELCERGSYKSLGFIRASVRSRNSTPTGDHEIAFCEARMEVISRNADPIKALASLLHVTNGVTDPELLGWAINKLRAMKSPEAEAEVQRYADEIEALPDKSPLKEALWGKRTQIRDLTPPKRKIR
jgi:hypothetical protein